MEKKLVSVITPAYNAEKYIADAIESVLRQTYTNWEMIIVDDGSGDTTGEIVKRYTNDSRIIYHRLEKNSGVAVAMNTAIESAHGSLLAFLDADDLWKPEKLQKHVAFTLKNDYAFTFSAYEIIREKGNKVVHAPKSQNYSQYMRNTVIGTSAAMLNLDKIGHDFRMVNLRKDLDSMTWAKLLRSGYTAYGLDKSLVYYRKVETSISNDKWKAAVNHWENCRKVEKLPFFKCLFYFIGYCFNALKKHYF
ncbi:MAG: glycosyltransferase family 2 protein [Lachnospiraceae bacterium]|nr:glycosyltransferase family 2 protein [Lachnospiraceae bacterium]